MFHKVVFHMRCGEIFSKHVAANLLENLKVEKFRKSVKNLLRYRHEFSVSLVGTQCRMLYFVFLVEYVDSNDLLMSVVE